MTTCNMCQKEIRKKEDLLVIANGLFAMPKAFHRKCYLHKDNELKIKKRHRLINSEAIYISLVVQLILVLVFAFILFKSEPNSAASMIAFPMALLIIVMIAEIIQKMYSLIRFEKNFKKKLIKI